MTFGPTIRNGVSVSVGSTPSLGGNVLNIPAQIGSLAAWYRYGQGITQTGGFASAWADQSGNNRPLLQGAGAAQPAVQADNSLLFNGTSHFMRATFTLNQPYTVCFLGRQVSWTNTDLFFSGATAGIGVQQRTATPQIFLVATSNVASNSNLAVNTYGAVIAAFNAASSVLRVNNTTETTGNPGVTNPGGITLGASNTGTLFGNIQVEEVVVFSIALSAVQRAQMVRYLAAVGGLSV